MKIEVFAIQKLSSKGVLRACSYKIFRKFTEKQPCTFLVKFKAVNTDTIVSVSHFFQDFNGYNIPK